jgi:hypothetical protein
MFNHLAILNSLVNFNLWENDLFWFSLLKMEWLHCQHPVVWICQICEKSAKPLFLAKLAVGSQLGLASSP